MATTTQKTVGKVVARREERVSRTYRLRLSKLVAGNRAMFGIKITSPDPE